MPASEKAEPQAGEAGPTSGAVDIERLAERVYRLMIAELRLERARGAGMDH